MKKWIPQILAYYMTHTRTTLTLKKMNLDFPKKTQNSLYDVMTLARQNVWGVKWNIIGETPFLALLDAARYSSFVALDCRCFVTVDAPSDRPWAPKPCFSTSGGAEQRGHIFRVAMCRCTL